SALPPPARKKRAAAGTSRSAEGARWSDASVHSPSDWSWHVAVDRRPVAELSFGVGAPAPRAAVEQHRAGERLAGTDGRSAPGEILGRRRSAAPLQRAIAELAICVVAPAEDVIRAQCAIV